MGFTIVNIYAPNRIANKFIKETLLQQESNIDPHTKWETSVTLHLPIDRSSRLTLNIEILDLTDVIIQMELVDFYRIFCPNTHRKYIHSSQYLMECSPKLMIYSDTKQVSGNKRKLKQHPASYQTTMA